MIKAARLPALAIGALLGLISTAHASLTPELQKTIRAATFEVVMKKPEKDPVTYEKPLPLDLMPYIERNDAYQSMGTAFALGNNRYVTAAHVMEAGVGSQFGPPELRRADGTVFAIDRILKFSAHEDFVVFSLRQDPQPQALTVNRDPKLDEPVLAVGNALGEGIVVRDGLFTSETPEEQDGRWKWIRFSAAASPGNSGGPLCDANGNVIGIVIGKSPNENLNYSLQIARVLDAEESKARFDQRSLVGLPYLDGTVTSAYKDEFNLPLTWQAFADAFQKVVHRHDDEAKAQLLRTYADRIFPKGPGTDDLLFEPEAGFQPRLIVQGADGTWSAVDPEYQEVRLAADGSIAAAKAAGARLLQLVRPNKASDDGFYQDSKAFMDIALKALDVRRVVGTDEVKVTSLGRAIEDSLFIDAYGRKWQQRTWAIPYRDSYLVGMLLPTPDGYSAIIKMTHSGELHATTQTVRLLAGLVDVSYRGTLAQWQSALRRRSLLPTALEEVKLDRSANWALRTPRFVSSVPSAVLPLSEDSPMSLTMGFMTVGSRTIWDIQAVWWEQDQRHEAGVGLWRRAQPPESAKLELRNRFASIRAHRTPYDGTVTRDSDSTFSATSILDVPGTTPGTVSGDLEYGLTVRMAGFPGSVDAAQSIENVAAVTQILERGSGNDVAKQGESVVDDAFTTLERNALADAAAMDPLLGKDIRGRHPSDDVRDLIQAMKKDIARIPSRSADQRRTLLDEQKHQLEWLGFYWNESTALIHSRDMWAAFLEKNHLPPDTPHQQAVTEAESRLRDALGHPPSAEWAERARLLREAYVEERRYLAIHASRLSTEAPHLVARTTPCPPPASTTSGSSTPKVGQAQRSLEELWPPQSKRLGEEGTVLATVQISSSGCVTALAIAGSAGSDLMDNAVRDFLESMTFVPGEVDGKAMGTTVSVPIVFKLNPGDVKFTPPAAAAAK